MLRQRLAIQGNSYIACIAFPVVNEVQSVAVSGSTKRSPEFGAACDSDTILLALLFDLDDPPLRVIRLALCRECLALARALFRSATMDTIRAAVEIMDPTQAAVSPIADPS